jgi:hypothetical protein
VILCDDDLIEWDDDYPPQLGQEEDKAQSKNRFKIRFYMRDLFSYTFNGNVSIF